MPKPFPTDLIGPNFRVVPGNDPRLLVVFNATGAKPHHFNFSKIGAQLRCNILYLNDPDRNWYQKGVPGFSVSIEDTVSKIRAWSKALHAAEILTLGSSMGAYGALLHGTALDARICAFSGETTLHLKHSRSFKMMPKETSLVVPDLTDRIMSHKRETLIFVGEEDPTDVYCATKVASAAHAQIIALTNADHATSRKLLEMDLLEPVLKSFLAGGPLPALPNIGSAWKFSKFAELQWKGFQAYGDGEPETALKFLKAALAEYPFSAYCYVTATACLLKLKKPKDGLEMAAMGLGFFPDNVELRFNFARCLRASGRLEHARTLHLQTLQRFPEHAATHHDLGLTLLILKNPSEAQQRFEEAARLDPENRNYAARALSNAASLMPEANRCTDQPILQSLA